MMNAFVQRISFIDICLVDSGETSEPIWANLSERGLFERSLFERSLFECGLYLPMALTRPMPLK